METYKYDGFTKYFIKMTNLAHTLKLSHEQFMNLVSNTTALNLDKKYDDLFEIFGTGLNKSVYHIIEPLCENDVSEKT